MTTEQDAGHDVAPSTTYTSAGAIPPVMGFPQQSEGQSASDIAFGVDRNGARHRPDHSAPLTDNAAMQAVERRTQAERLLTSEKVTSGQDAIAALEILLSIDESHRAAAIDHLAAHALDNLLDRLEDSQRIRLAALVDASQDPKRKLKLWAAQHMSRARNDLNRYKGDFGEPDRGVQNDEQQLAQRKYERREKGVNATEAEVQAESARLLAKGDALTVADVDAMRTRKDAELGAEMKHNVNLVAESTPKADGSPVQWSADEVAQLDSSLSKLPDEHVHGDTSVEKYIRRENRHAMQSLGGQYLGDHIDIYTNSHQQPPGRPGVAPVEYAVTHEVGHEVASENKAAFAKFEKTAGWRDVSRRQVEQEGATDKQLEHMGSPQVVGEHVIHKDDDGKYHQVDRTAVPSGDAAHDDRAKYSLSNSNEHFAEMYAMAVETPQLLYADYVEEPAINARAAAARVRDQQNLMRTLQPGTTAYNALATQLESSKHELALAEKVMHQRRELFDIIRNDIFHAEEGARAAVGRLQKRGASADVIRSFLDQAARISTPQQLDELERQATH